MNLRFFVVTAAMVGLMPFALAEVRTEAIGREAALDLGYSRFSAVGRILYGGRVGIFGYNGLGWKYRDENHVYGVNAVLLDLEDGNATTGIGCGLWNSSSGGFGLIVGGVNSVFDHKGIDVGIVNCISFFQQGVLDDNVFGAQIGVVNFNASSLGVQLGLWNLQNLSCDGTSVQMGLANVMYLVPAGVGAQMGVWNYAVANESTIAQVGLWNVIKQKSYSKYSEIQLGLFNFSEITRGFSTQIGILNLVKDKESRSWVPFIRMVF